MTPGGGGGVRDSAEDLEGVTGLQYWGSEKVWTEEGRGTLGEG